MSMKHYLKQSLVVFIFTGIMILPGCKGAAASDDTLKLIAFNVMKCSGWPAENVDDSTVVADLIAGELSRYDADVINFSEAPDESTVRQIAEKLGMNYVYFPSTGSWPGALLSVYEITDFAIVPVISGQRPEDLFTRHWGKAIIRINKDKTIIIHSLHLYPGDNPVSAEIRTREITEVLKSTKKDLKGRISVIVMGDLNHRPDNSEYSLWPGAGFTDAFVAAGEGSGATIKADAPDKRIDYILVRGKLSGSIKVSRPLFEGAFRTNPSDPDSFALSDHLPQYTEILIK